MREGCLYLTHLLSYSSCGRMNTERQWKEVNQLLLKHKKVLIQLDADGLCTGGTCFKDLEHPSGRGTDKVDLFCVIMTFGKKIEDEINALYVTRRFMKKHKRTKNPAVEQGAMRKFERYFSEQSHGLVVSSEAIEAVREAGLLRYAPRADATYLAVGRLPFACSSLLMNSRSLFACSNRIPSRGTQTSRARVRAT